MMNLHLFILRFVTVTKLSEKILIFIVQQTFEQPVVFYLGY